jgi:nicotinate-nucleotide adenylyltransferase
MLMPNSSTKNGLFFGSFNPVHNGHLIIADYMLDQEGLDEIWFIVSPQNPLKESKKLANGQQRLEMMKLAVAPEPRFKVSDVEFAMPRPSYTFDTLEMLSRIYPERNFFLIIGSDNLEEFHLWKNHEQILKKYQILVYPRNEEINSSFAKEPNVKITQAPLIEISSTKIREFLKAGRNVDAFIPDEIKKYILDNGLYGI